MASKAPGTQFPLQRGYDAHSRRHAPVAKRHNASGFLQNADGEILYLWLTDISADFSVSGQVGQSRMLREWFPRSFNDVTLTLTGNVASTQEYNRLAAFIRAAHWTALQRINDGSKAKPTLTFHLFDRVPKTWAGAQRNVKGAHRPWSVEGYVKTVRAGAVHQEVAPEYQLAFIVAESALTANTGIWSDTAADITPLRNILAILGMNRKNGKVGSGFVRDPVAALEGRYAKQDIHDGVWSIKGAVNTLDLSPTDWFG